MMFLLTTKLYWRASICRTTENFLLNRLQQQQYLIHPTVLFGYITNCHFATDQQKKNEEKEVKKQQIREKKTELTNRVGQERSYLEEILIEKEQEPKTTGQKIKRAASTSFFIAFGFISVAALGVLLYLVFDELFSFNTPQGVYKDALKRVKKDDRCLDLFGTKLLAHGEESGRGRRRHISHMNYEKDGQKRLRVMFHIKGEKAIGRVHAEVARMEDGNWDYRYICAEADTFPKTTITLIDNR